MRGSFFGFPPDDFYYFVIVFLLKNVKLKVLSFCYQGLVQITSKVTFIFQQTSAR